MATIKAYTDISQSKMLAKILPLKSADMHYHYDNDFGELESIPTITEEDDHFVLFSKDVRCWSLAALLGVLPEYNLQRTDWGNKTEYKIVVTIDEENYASKNYDNPLDACVDLIEHLNKLKLL